MSLRGRKTVGAVGEFGLIERIRRILRKGAGVELGVGDDAAVIRVGGQRLIFTTDMILEDRHFRLNEATGFEIGWKALAVNLSDIAAMGGVPAYAVAALGIPGSLSLNFVREIYKGLEALARRFRVRIVGGDTNASEKLILSVALVGKTEGAAVRRSGAKAGDVIFVSGSLGGSYASRKHLRFLPRLKESRYLVRHAKLHAMMDISDGLASDIHRLAESSGVGACLVEEAIPRSPGVSLNQALTEGEDFELLWTLPPAEAAALSLSSASRRGLVPLTPVGKIMPKSYGVRLLGTGGRDEALAGRGFDHYR